MVLLAVGLWLGWGLWMPARVAPGQTVLLRPGWSTRHIAMELRQAGIIHSAQAFLLYHYVARPSTLKAGEYKFDSPESAIQVHERIARGDVYKHTVVIPEGFNMFDIAGAIESAGLGSGEDFLQAAHTQTALVADLDPQATSLEGYLFPDTYEFTRTQSMSDMAAAMVRRFRQAAREIGLLPNPDLHRIVTLASIVEKETAVPEERPMVAGVYYNRLAKDMALNADPSVIYAALLAGRYDGVIHQSDLLSTSSYNTYKFAGLPPGPIANAGREALKAALHPAVNDYFYFVSDNNGHHRFARTLDEHSRNVALYRQAVGAANR
jgi:UPF0755 protein